MARFKAWTAPGASNRPIVNNTAPLTMLFDKKPAISACRLVQSHVAGNIDYLLSVKTARIASSGADNTRYQMSMNDA